MFEHLVARAVSLGERQKSVVLDRLAARVAPPGVDVQRQGSDIVLAGKRLRLRFVKDPALRNFSR